MPDETQTTPHDHVPDLYPPLIQRRYRWLQGLSVLFSVLLLVVAIVDLTQQPSPQAIYAGEPFLYWAYVNIGMRAPWVLAYVVMVAVWFFTRAVWRVTASIRILAMILVGLACCMLTLVAPLRSLPTFAYHLQTLTVATADSNTIYHLFYQTYGMLETGCDYVVVTCDPTGWQCQYRDHIPYADVCLGQYANIHLQQQGNRVIVIHNGEYVIEFDAK